MCVGWMVSSKVNREPSARKHAIRRAAPALARRAPRSRRREGVRRARAGAGEERGVGVCGG